MVTQGGTLADLRGYIEARGGHVIAATTLMGGRDSDIFAIRPGTLHALHQRFGDDLETWWKDRYGHGFDAFTESEAKYLLRFKSADAVRDRIAAAGQARGGAPHGRNPGGEETPGGFEEAGDEFRSGGIEARGEPSGRVEPQPQPQGSDPASAADAQRAIDDAGGDFEITVTDENGNAHNVSTRDALREAEDEARAADEFNNCVGAKGTTE